MQNITMETQNLQGLVRETKYFNYSSREQHLEHCHINEMKLGYIEKSFFKKKLTFFM